MEHIATLATYDNGMLMRRRRKGGQITTNHHCISDCFLPGEQLPRPQEGDVKYSIEQNPVIGVINPQYNAAQSTSMVFADYLLSPPKQVDNRKKRKKAA